MDELGNINLSLAQTDLIDNAYNIHLSLAISYLVNEPWKVHLDLVFSDFINEGRKVYDGKLEDIDPTHQGLDAVVANLTGHDAETGVKLDNEIDED